MNKLFGNSVILPAVLLALIMTVSGYAQTSTTAPIDTLKVPAGQKMSLDGVILQNNPQNNATTLIVRTFGNATYSVSISAATEIREKKSNPFRGAKKYSQADLVPGLQVEIKGQGLSSGALGASAIKFKNDDHIVAQAMDTRVLPVEKDLRNTQTRLGESERNAERLSGQIQELSAITNSVRGDANTARQTADRAIVAAAGAQSTADNARAGVRAANERISLIDDYELTTSTTVYFNAGSAELSEGSRLDLGAFADQIQSEKGYIIEVAGYASSDGDVAANRRLSQKRADAVIQYLAENFTIPMRRFVTPIGYGESQPIADNKTKAGREENRRVEVRLLINKGLTAAPGVIVGVPTGPSARVNTGTASGTVTTAAPEITPLATPTTPQTR